MLAKLLVRRLLLGALTLLAISLVVFLTAEVLPGDIAARVLGRESTELARQAFRERLNLDRPVQERYWLWIQGVVRGDFGQALTNDREVADIIAPRLRNTLVIGGVAFALYIPVTIVLASVAAIYRDRAPDADLGADLIGLSVPEFVSGTVLSSFSPSFSHLSCHVPSPIEPTPLGLCGR
jgi:peptide/nickel transport system permease protein